MSMILEQIELEKQMTQLSVDKFRRELNKSIRQGNFSNTQTGNTLILKVLNDFRESVNTYVTEYGKGYAVRSTNTARIVQTLGVDTACYITLKILFNSMQPDNNVQSCYRAIGQALEDEFKMRECRKANKFYYESIKKDLNNRGAKSRRKKIITMYSFNNKLNFHTDTWAVSDKVQAGLTLVTMFIDTTGLVKIRTDWHKKKQINRLEPTKELIELTENINEKLEILQPIFLPMICPPKEWTGLFQGGYLSPYLKRNKVLKNNDRAYLTKLKHTFPSEVYKALNIIQATEWQINKDVLNVIKVLWNEGYAVAGLPNREDEAVKAFPYPDITDRESYTEEQKQIVQRWKRETYETHKKNAAQRSIRLLTSQLLRIAEQFKDYESIYFPYQMDFRGRMYPIPVLLQPQGSDMAKGLLRFARGKPITDKTAEKWFYVHGASCFGIDKVSYDDRVKWINEHREEIINYALNPICNRGWTEADKPFQFLAWCFEFNAYVSAPKQFVTRIPVHLDGTCNGLTT